MMSNRPGFSLIRPIVIVACAAIVLVILFIVFNPARRIRIKRNATRATDIALILSAVQAYRTENGTLPPGIDTDAERVQLIGRNPGSCGVITCADYVLPTTGCTIEHLGASLQPFIATMPADPKTGTDSDTRYFINRDAGGGVTVGACDPESEDPSDALPPPVLEVTE